MDLLSQLSLCSISRLEQLVWSVLFFGRVRVSGKDMLRSMSWTVSGSAGAAVTSGGERGVAVDALNTPW